MTTLNNMTEEETAHEISKVIEYNDLSDRFFDVSVNFEEFEEEGYIIVDIDYTDDNIESTDFIELANELIAEIIHELETIKYGNLRVDEVQQDWYKRNFRKAVALDIYLS